MKKILSGKSLKVKIVTLCVGSVLLVGLCSFGVLRYVMRAWTSQQVEAFEAQSRTMGDGIAAQFYERYGDVQAFALNPLMRSRDRAQMVEALNAYSAMYGIYDLIMVVDTDGKLQAVNSLGPDGKGIDSARLYGQSFAGEPWFKSVMAEKFTADKAKNFQGTYFEPSINDPLTSLAYGGLRYGSGFSAPIRDSGGKVVGVVTNRAGARWYESAVQEVQHEMAKSGFPGTRLSLFSKEGDLIFSYNGKPGSESSGTSQKEFLAEQRAKLLHAASSGAEVTSDPKSGEEKILALARIEGAKFVGEVGWLVAVEDGTAEAMASVNWAARVFYLVFALALAAAVAVAYAVSKGISSTLSTVSGGLTSGAGEVGIAVTELSAASSDLSASSQQQSAALQETASAVEEISTMVRRSAELAKDADQSSLQSKKKAEEGGEIVARMIGSMDAISRSTEDVASQLAESNEKTSSMLKVIEEVGTKTKVINDIVFQTKLLSFNASVEAARAGEHGKGFAVVAEEVGNLAQMSGNAAKEINKLLEESIVAVSEMVKSTKEKVDASLSSARETVKSGNQVARECEQVLKAIVESSGSISGMVTSLSQASAESARGVSEISSALQQMDQATNVNANAAQSCSEASQKLNQQVLGLRDSAESLNVIVDGKFRIVGFEWKDAYALGVRAMDDEHKVLIDRINALAAALDSGKQVMAAFEALASYTAEHFAHEEKYQQSISYPEYPAHKAIHTSLLKQVGQYGDRIKAGNLNPSELMNFLNDWLLKHILGVDMKYARFSRGEKSMGTLSAFAGNGPKKAA